jgi:hypothetical protein
VFNDDVHVVEEFIRVECHRVFVGRRVEVYILCVCVCVCVCV